MSATAWQGQTDAGRRAVLRVLRGALREPRNARHGEAFVAYDAAARIRARAALPAPGAAEREAERAVVEAAVRWRMPATVERWQKIVISAERDLENAVDALAAARKDGAT